MRGGGLYSTTTTTETINDDPRAKTGGDLATITSPRICVFTDVYSLVKEVEQYLYMYCTRTYVERNL